MAVIGSLQTALLPFNNANQELSHPIDGAGLATAPLPTLPFDFDGLRATMATFTRRFDTFIERRRRHLLDERNAFRVTLAETADTIESLSVQTAAIKQRAAQQDHAAAGRGVEAAEMEGSVRALTQQRDDRLKQVEALRHKLAGRRREVELRRGDFQRTRDEIVGRRREDIAEREQWEETLGVRVDGVKPGGEVLRFTFDLTNRYDNQPTSKTPDVWFELDLGGKECAFINSSPRISRTIAIDMVRLHLGGDGDENLLGLLKEMRTILVQQ